MRATALLALVPFAGFIAASCGSKSDDVSSVPDATADVSAPVGPGDAGLADVFEQTLDASCLVQVASPPVLGFAHVPIGTLVDYDSNPPSSGDHYPIWAAFQAYAVPVPRGYYVHDLEHGAIDLLYKCDDASGCPEIAAALQRVSDALPDDPLCAMTGEGVRVRTVITPDPLLDVPVAAAAWGFTYRAECVDEPTLLAFALAHYGQGREDLCSPGTTEF